MTDNPEMTRAAMMVTHFVGASLIAGKSVKEIVAELDEKLNELRRGFAIQSISPLTSPVYSITKAAADALRDRC